MKIFSTLKYLGLLLLLQVALFLYPGCGDDGPIIPASDIVTDPYPLAVGNSWEYELNQSIYVQSDTLIWSLSSTGIQKVSVTRTEAITGAEAFGVQHHHAMNYLLDPSTADTTIEEYYLAPGDDGIILKGILSTYNTGGFIPFGLQEDVEQLVTRVGGAGSGSYIPLTRLSRQLMGPALSPAFTSRLDAMLASDGVINRDEFYAYEDDYLYVSNELYKGKRWVSSEAGGVGGVDISQRVTNILPSLSGFEGPIAEVEINNTFVDVTASEQYKIRYYYKSGVGIIQAELSDPEFMIFLNVPGVGVLYLGIGEWVMVKKLTSYSVK
jgi:hypothetical protein